MGEISVPLVSNAIVLYGQQRGLNHLQLQHVHHGKESCLSQYELGGFKRPLAEGVAVDRFMGNGQCLMGLPDELILCLFENTDQGRGFLTVDLVSDDFSCSSVSNQSYINHTVCTFLFHQMEWAELS